jgi:cytochrome c biogenesis protein CcmG, thiol:disulfide interchange protein DsbE
MRGWATALRHPGRTGKLVYAVGAAVLVLAGIVTLTGSGKPGKNSGDNQAAQIAKSFSLPELGHPGHTISLASLRGRPVIVNFFASWCAPCKHETPMLAKFADQEAGKVIVIGIDANDSQGAALQFLQTAGVKYPVGFDPFPARTTTSYGVYALPQTFFLNATHHIVKHVVGPVTMQVLVAGVELANKDRG